MQRLGEDLSQWLWLVVLDTSLTNLVLAILGSVWVQSQQYLSVLQRVLLLYTSSLGGSVALWLFQDRLDFAGVDQSVDVSVADDVGWEKEVLLECRGLGGGSVDIVESLESIGGPDDEATEMATRSELKKVEGVY